MDTDTINGICGKTGVTRRGHRTQKGVFQGILNEQSKSSGIVFLGEISGKHPTVSHVLMEHPDYRKSCWKIIHSEQNNNKSYTRIKEGTKIYIHESDLRLSWEHDTENASEKTVIEPDSFSEKFMQAVKRNVGMEYDQVNCYELIIQGLRQLGYRYDGYGGLKQTLMNMALERGESINTYLTGEGLIEVSGSGQYVKKMNTFSDYEENTDEIFNEILPHIQPGQILSFSTPSQGHTGIISGKEGMWTYVNSGILDHDLRSSALKKGVGEESLTLEILNWVRLAARKNEPLVLTLGHLDEKKLEKYKIVPWET
ncbi:MAG: hypothetical protein ABIK15_10425 [Pseudomonadota bacterium]